ncbi:DUF6431 domain-containing protein [Fodinisporobacter ferrooxydans]|uniref:DUF6431 domain-containing protein n=1 Tax=Fodinisporobacter ferrooxydans TaxID=2901836 RepID=A0ABY4CMQ6_9BACL|nr:DUF6431 domain-containing protein [Alicyclobacillaceae bacterium MYW30-H2]UOF90076.1 DUF6431 domain-containing protein [Alicyclobacillaceae bacterium MYW30-H2]UOF90811.1 DUF6431 domain-containing protein [Alicyclobacillaceae bacterium MYW30-H2]UOF91035.1 DUF6431 domain-containing protein [Alicyclobacillaceae bacterium MYW30-H2]UOF91461.1 DUF6431 domain-containing protein [Alicyclobacillaceae bacterium MYW30-H2]
MIITHHFPVDLPCYFQLGRANNFPVIESCPICKSQQKLKRHGFYNRYAIETDAEYRIPICRYKCPNPKCNKTFAILPDFLLPYFQNTLSSILQTLQLFWAYCVLLFSRQLVCFYRKRLMAKSKIIEMFFRLEGNKQIFPEDPIEKAIMLLNMIETLPRVTFIRKWHNHYISSFMAHSFYHGSPVAKTE